MAKKSVEKREETARSGLMMLRVHIPHSGRKWGLRKSNSKMKESGRQICSMRMREGYALPSRFCPAAEC